ncbi:hypothetical protein ACQ86N_07990 [Puia sp. P3]|uniref:hypothetical protein n=1 Tax=Puia sp. P3 TaxID=3423952 RepID=UPI003D66897E
MRRGVKFLIYAAGAIVILLVAAYLVAGPLIRQKVDAALRQLPPSLQVSYASLDLGVFTGSAVLRGVEVKFVPLADTQHRHWVETGRVELSGVRLWDLVFSKELRAASLTVEGCRAELDEYLLKKDIPLPRVESPFAVVSIAKIRWKDVRMEVHRGGVKTVYLAGEGSVNRDRLAELLIDTLRSWPGVDKLELGRTKGHQVDWVAASGGDIRVTGLDVDGLFAHRLIADEISVGHGVVYVFRDRRLPLEAGEKPMPAEMLKRLPMEVRVRSVRLGLTRFTYEEFPKKGDSTGVLRILRLRCVVAPLINHPLPGDPDYVVVKTEGSLMGSGTVEAATRVPLQKGEAYRVEGAFHQLDLTTLNRSAETLGVSIWSQGC